MQAQDSPLNAAPPLQSGYLLHEAPVRTWLPLVGCSVAAAAGAYMRQRRLEWAALGGIMSFLFTVWQVGSHSSSWMAGRGGGGLQADCWRPTSDTCMLAWGAARACELACGSTRSTLSCVRYVQDSNAIQPHPLSLPAGAGPAGSLTPWPSAFACWTAVQSTAGGQPLSPNPLLLPLQVLAPLVRRLMALRTRLLDNDRAAKKRLDLAAEHLK